MAQVSVTLSSGTEMPLVGFGTWQLTGESAYRSVRSALEVGYRHIDTATVYENEAEVGRAILDSGVPRRELFLTTKMPPEAAGREHPTLEASLQALGTDYLDLWLIHWPPARGLDAAIWQQFRRLRDEGSVRGIGVSNYSLSELDELAAASGEMPAVNQIPWAPERFDAGALDAHRRRGVVVEGYSAFKLTDLAHPTTVAIAARHQVSPAQVIVRWHVQHRVVVIPKSATPARIAANFDVFDFELSGEDMDALDALRQGPTGRRR